MTRNDYLMQEILAEFRGGKNTYEIASKRMMPEARVSQLLWIARCRDRGLPATFLNRAREVMRIPEAA